MQRKEGREAALHVAFEYPPKLPGRPKPQRPTSMDVQHTVTGSKGRVASEKAQIKKLPVAKICPRHAQHMKKAEAYKGRL